MWVSSAELAEVLQDEPCAIKLCKWFGGVGYYMPAQANPKHVFARVLSIGQLQLLCSAYSGLTIQLPNGRKAEPQKAAIVHMLKNGYSHRSIATKLCVTQRWVEMVAQMQRRNTQLLLPL